MTVLAASPQQRVNISMSFSVPAFLVALQFLTTIPVHLKVFPDEKTRGHSLLYYPLVGLLMGLLLTAIYWLGNGIATSIHAAILLAAWIGLSGGLHLDGLADSADAWIGGRDDQKKTLAIMKDPCCGPAAVVTLVLVLLIKFVALEQILSTGYWPALIVIPLLSRTSLIALFLLTPYVRAEGLGRHIAQHLPPRPATVIILFTAITTMFILGYTAVWLLISLAMIFYLLRTLMLRRIGGTTGDTAGALLEINEVIMLLVIAVIC